MAWTGQPVTPTVYSRTGGKVSDGQSVVVSYTNGGGETATLEAGTFAVIGGFRGIVAKTVEVATGATEEVPLLIEQAEYRAQVYLTAAGGGLAMGDPIYWDAANSRLTEDDGAGANEQVAKATEAVSAPAADGLIWANFLLLPQA